MRYKILTILLAATVMAGCSKSSDTLDPSTPDSYEPSTTPIAFQTEYNWGDEEATKGALVEQFEEDDTFSVLGYYLSSGELISTATPNFMYNQEVIYDGANWSYSPIKYWSNNTADKFRFYAFAPHSTTIAPSPNTYVGLPYLTYTPNVNAPEMIDFMTAPSIEASINAPSVIFEFEHQLAQLAFSAKHSGSEKTTDGQTGDMVKITGITIAGIYPHKGSFNESGDFEWEESADNSQEAVESVTDIANGGLIDNYIINGGDSGDLVMDDDGYYRVTNTAGQIMMSPQTFSNTEDGKFEVGVEFELVNSYNSTTQSAVAMNAAATMTFDKLKIEKGYTYNMRFEFSVTGYNYVLLSADIVREEWKDAIDYDFGTVE